MSRARELGHRDVPVEAPALPPLAPDLLPVTPTFKPPDSASPRPTPGYELSATGTRAKNAHNLGKRDLLLLQPKPPASITLDFPSLLRVTPMSTSTSTATPHSPTTSISSPDTRVHSPTPTLPTPAVAELKAQTHAAAGHDVKPIAHEGATDCENFLAGTGSVEDPYVVGWREGEKEDPYNWSKNKK